MEFDKLSVGDDKFELNLKFYYWLKHLVKTNLTDKQANELLSSLFLNRKLSAQLTVLDDYSQGIKGIVIFIKNRTLKTPSPRIYSNSN